MKPERWIDRMLAASCIWPSGTSDYCIVHKRRCGHEEPPSHTEPHPLTKAAERAVWDVRRIEYEGTWSVGPIDRTLGVPGPLPELRGPGIVTGGRRSGKTSFESLVAEAFAKEGYGRRLDLRQQVHEINAEDDWYLDGAEPPPAYLFR